MATIRRHTGTRVIGLLILMGLLGGGVLPVQAQEVQRPLPQPVVNDTASLRAVGCEVVTLETAAADTRGWQAVVPRDADGRSLLLCPPQTVAQLQTLPAGQVAGAQIALAQGASDPFSAEWTAFKRLAQLDVVGAVVGFFANKALGPGLELVRQILWVTFVVYKTVGVALLTLLSIALVALLSVSQFTTNPVVQQAWPLALGVANLGFMIALVVIALFTVLRLEVGGGVRRLLPRLLIGALLVNFSLVIAGLVLDVSRLLMAIIPRFFGVNLQGLAFELLAAEGHAQMAKAIADAVVQIAPDSGLVGWERVITEGLSMVHVWFAVIAFAVVSLMLLVRYIMLLILLILSPFAYLFVAFPNTGNLARKWWTMFLRYALYGPIALFFLVAGTAAAQSPIWRQVFNPDRADNVAAAHWLDGATLAVFLYLAVTAGRYAGIAGGVAAVKLATRGGRGLRQAGMFAPRLAGRATGAAAGAATRRASYPVRDYVRGVDDNLRKGKSDLSKAYRFVRGVKRGKDAKPLPGEQETAMQKLGKKHGAALALSPEDRQAATGFQEAAQRREAAHARGEPYHPGDDPDLSVESLSRGKAVNQMDAKLIGDVAGRGSADQQVALGAGLANADQLSEDQSRELISAIKQLVKEQNEHGIEKSDKRKQADQESASRLVQNVTQNVDVVNEMSGSDRSQWMQAIALITDSKKAMERFVTTINRADQRKRSS